jgi:drug/metabolite transporter (DMT)-like permease
MNRFFYHLVVFLVVAIWGTTFVFTKLLLNAGLTAAQIFVLRFVVAYILLLGYSLTRWSFRWFSASWKDELLMMALGVTGGSLYFLTENSAMIYTTTTNTSLIVCLCPLFAALIISLFYRSERLHGIQIVGSILAALGVIVVVLNGHFVLHLSPLGDSLAFAACLCWALYSLLMIPANKRYNTLFITRKVFFYGLVSMIPYFLIWPDWPPVSLVLRPDVLCNLLFLGSVASMACFLAWNWGMKKLGAVVVTNYVYFNPVTTVIFAWLILSERITLYFIIGTLLILLGMYLCNRHQKEAGTELKVNNSAKSKQTRWPGN